TTPGRCRSPRTSNRPLRRADGRSRLFRVPYAMLAAASAALLPPWAREPLGLPLLPRAEHWCVRPAGAAVTGTIRWAMRRPPPDPGG
ncbi:oxygenase MpaB family protein, partial [Streptomyces sp. 12297]